MGRRSWAPPDQLAWLEARVSGFHAAQAKNDTRSFIKREKQAYFDHFWKDPATGKERESMLDMDGNLVSKAKREKQFGVWFWNRCDGKAAAKKNGSGGLDLVPKKAGRLHAYQAYMTLHKGRIMPQIQKEYEEYLTQYIEDHADDPGEEVPPPPDAWWKFACARAKDLLEEESDEIKEEVEEYHTKSTEASGLDEFLEEEDGDSEGAPKAEAVKRAKAIHDAIGLLPKSLLGVLESVEEQTGWKGTVLIGGPRPDTGELSALFVHNGQTLNLGNTFPQATAKWDDLAQAFNKFIVSCYSPDIGERLKTAYQVSTSDDADSPSRSASPSGPESHPPTPSTTSTTLPAAESTEGAPAGDTAKSAAKKTAKEKGKKKRTWGESSYDELRESTIAQNKELFHALELSEGLEMVKEPRKKREKRVPTEGAPTTRATRSRTAASTASTTSSAPPNPSNAPPEGPTTETASTNTAVPQGPPSNTAEPSAVVVAPPTAVDTAAPASASPSTTLPTVAGPTTDTTTPAGEASATGLPSTTPLDPPTTGATPLAPSTENTSATARDASTPSAASIAARDGFPIAPSLAPASTSPSTANPSLAAAPSSGIETPSRNSTTPQLQGSLASTVMPTSASSNSPGDDRPEWVEDAMTYFALVEGGPEWNRLVAEWLEFETVAGGLGIGQENKRLATEHRPEEVKIWMKNHRSYEKLPKIKSPAQFSVAWKRWWISLQPGARGAEDAGSWPIPRVEPVDPADWGTVARGGCNGFFLVILTLAWWLWAPKDKNPEDMADVLEALDDVSWVCRAATAYMRTCSEQDADSDERPSKRMKLM